MKIKIILRLNKFNSFMKIKRRSGGGGFNLHFSYLWDFYNYIENPRFSLKFTSISLF